MATEVHAWLASRLTALGIDAETFAEYVMGLVMDDSYSHDDLVEAVTETLSSTTDKDVTPLVTELLERWKAHSAAAAAAAAAAEAARREAERAAAAAELERLRAAGTQATAARSSELSEEDRAARRLVMERYGVDAIEYDEDGAIITKAAEGAAEAEAPSELTQANDNKERVKALARQQREADKASHEANQARIKKQQEEQKKKREEEKKRTARRERQRG